MLYGWEVKAGWLIQRADKFMGGSKTVDPSLTCAIPERFREEYRTQCKVLFTLLFKLHDSLVDYMA